MKAEQQPREDPDARALSAAMAYSIRSKLMRALAIEPGTGAAELAEQVGEPLRSVRKQLKILLGLGVVDVQRRESRRNLQKLYFVNRSAPWIRPEQDEELSDREHRLISVEVLRFIFDDARAAISWADFGKRKHRVLASVPGKVDGRGWQELSDLHHEMLDRVYEIVTESRERLEDGEEEPIRVTSGLIFLEMPSRSPGEGDGDADSSP